MILMVDSRNFYFAFIHGSLVKQVFIISLIAIEVVNISYVVWLISILLGPEDEIFYLYFTFILQEGEDSS